MTDPTPAEPRKAAASGDVEGLREAASRVIGACGRTRNGRYVGRTVDFDATVNELLGVLAKTPAPPAPHDYDHDDTHRHHHDADTGDPVWWENTDQFGGDFHEHRHATIAAPRAPVGELDAELLARAIAGDPDDRGLGCSESVTRSNKPFGTRVEACGRDTYAFVVANYMLDNPTDPGENLCKLHATLSQKRGGRFVRLATEQDDRDAEQSRWNARMAKARSEAGRIADAYRALSERRSGETPLSGTISADERTT